MPAFPITDHVAIEPSILYFGTPVVLVTAMNADGTVNIWALGRDVVLGLGAAGQGAENLRHGGECVLNFPVPAETVRPPRIAECPLQFEARVKSVHGGKPDALEGHLVVETEVLRIHAHRAITIPGTNHIDTARWSPLLYVFRHYFGTGERLGKTFRAEC